MDEHDLCLMVAIAQSAIEGNTFQPSSHVCLRDTPLKHTLEVYDEVECHFVNVVRVNKYHIFAPFSFL
jgi:hypothetical protein